MRTILTVLTLMVATQLFAQQDSTSTQKARKRERGDVLAGDSIRILKPEDGKEFKAIELYVKTRFVNVPMKWDSTTGEGFYEHYFTVGDFDSRPLPLEYCHTKVKVISIKNFRDKDNSTVTVFFCQGKKPNEIIWVMLEKAFFAGEMLLPTD